MRASSITPGRRLSTLPWIATLARLPNVTWIAPDSIATALMYSLTILSATGRPAAALSTGSFPVADHDQPGKRGEIQFHVMSPMRRAASSSRRGTLKMTLKRCPASTA